jgi:hypothetical protein
MIKTKLFSGVLILALLLPFVTPDLQVSGERFAESVQKTITIDVVVDATIRSWDSSSNFGTDHYLEISYKREGRAATLIRFDTSSIPIGATIDSAILQLFLDGASGSDALSVGAYFINNHWDESTVTWNSEINTGTIGINASIDTVVGSYKSWYISSFVQSWVDNPASNNGVLLLGPGSGTYYERWFESHEHNEHVPQLEIIYHVPVLSGQVFKGEVGDQTTPIPGVNLKLYCSNNSGVLGRQMATTTTNAEGWYGLEVIDACEYYQIVETDFEGYTSVGATSAGGMVINSNFIEYSAPLTGKTLTGNKFWDTISEMPLDIVSGPSVVDINPHSALISWQTNQPADSLVLFDSLARLFRYEVGDSSQTTQHEVLLDGLTPSTTYHFKVRSTEMTGSNVESRDRFFKTLSTSDTRIPTIVIRDPGIVSGTIILYADAEDDTGIEKVTFYLEDTLIHTDYSPPYQFTLDTTQYPDGQLELAAIAEDLAGKTEMDVVPLDVINKPDLTLPTVTITTPADGASVKGKVQVKAALLDNIGLYEAYFTVDGKYLEKQIIEGSPTQANVTFEWDTTGLPAKTYRIGVVAYDLEYFNDPYRDYGYDTRDIVVQYLAPPEPAKLQITRDITRYENILYVTLHVTNVGGQAAEDLSITDWLHGFQPISASVQVPVNADYHAEYFAGSKDTLCAIVSHEPIPKNSTLNFTYAVVPILSDDPFFLFENPIISGWSLSPKISIGYKTRLVYHDTAAQDHWVDETVMVPATQAMTSGQWKPLFSAYSEAIKSADYLIVTNPKKLEWAITPWQPIAFNDLLSDMAWLAKERQGVVGYMDTYDKNVLLNLIEPGGTWANMLAPQFTKPLGGYVLIVGEVEIVPSWTIWYNAIDYSDQPYAGGYPTKRIVGRIIGNDHKSMSNAIRASLGIALNWAGYEFDRSSAYLVSGTDGTDNGVSAYKDCINDIGAIMNKKGITSTIQHLYDLPVGTRVAAFKTNAPGNDVIVFRDHGNVDEWSPVHTDNITGNFFDPPLNLGTKKPFAFSLSCLAGCYENHRKHGGGDYNIAEAFFDQGVAVYIGATESTGRSINNAAGRWFFKNWDTSETIGEVFGKLESIISESWASKYNLYGDPKFGAVSLPISLSGAPQRSIIPADNLDIVVPDFEVSHQNGTDYVSIPEGYWLLEEEEPEIPFYPVQFDYPVGIRVQNVILTDQSGLSTTTGLNLPIVTLEPECVSTSRPQASTTDAWLPTKDFDWVLVDNPDGTTTLKINIFAFKYHPLSTDIRFYKNYSFKIETVPTTNKIVHLKTVYPEYDLGESAIFELGIENIGEPQDIVVEALVNNYITDEIVDNLLMTMLRRLQGNASFTIDYDTNNLEPGYYLIDVTLRDVAGNNLDHGTVLFRVGNVSAELTHLTATPTIFKTGDEINISLGFVNTGSVKLDATAVIVIHDKNGDTVKTFTHEIVDLDSGTSIEIAKKWNTAFAVEGIYEINGLVHYDSSTTDSIVTRVNTYINTYLPLITHNAP